MCFLLSPLTNNSNNDSDKILLQAGTDGSHHPHPSNDDFLLLVALQFPAIQNSWRNFFPYPFLRVCRNTLRGLRQPCDLLAAGGQVLIPTWSHSLSDLFALC